MVEGEKDNFFGDDDFDPSKDQTKVIDGLTDIWPQIEQFAERLGKVDEYKVEVTEYIKDLREELSDLRRIRNHIVTLTIGLVLLFYISFFVIILYNSNFLIPLDVGTQVALVGALISAPTFLILAVLRGAFRSRAERNKDEDLPEHLKRLNELTSLLSQN